MKPSKNSRTKIKTQRQQKPTTKTTTTTTAMTFDTIIVFAVIAQALLSDPTNAASQQLRGNKAALDPIVAPLPPLVFSQTSIESEAPAQKAENQHRSLVAARTITITNKCEQDITNFHVRYNAEWVPITATKYALRSGSFGDVVVKRGESLTISEVTSEEIHFYALHADFDFATSEWDITEVAKTPTESDILTHITINDSFVFPWYMEEIGDDFRVDLCGSDETATTTSTTTPTTTTTTPTTTTTTPTTTTTTTTPTATTTTTTPTTTTTTTTPTTTTPTTTTTTTTPTATTTTPTTPTTTTKPSSEDSPSDDNTLIIVNNCDTDISHFDGYFDMKLVRPPGSRRYEIQSKTTGRLSIKSGDSVTVDNFVGDEIHFYALDAVWNRRNRDHEVTEVASTPVQSRAYTHVTFTTGAGTQLVFPFYVQEIGEDMVLALCGSN
eukprot:scaffold44883_cov160-Amphora_coffeaeformis.AAC.2